MRAFFADSQGDTSQDYAGPGDELQIVIALGCRANRTSVSHPLSGHFRAFLDQLDFVSIRIGDVDRQAIDAVMEILEELDLRIPC